MKKDKRKRDHRELALACLELYDSLISKAGARNALNELVRAVYRNAPINMAPSDQPRVENVVNKIVTVSHNYVKFMSNQPEVRVPLPYNMNDIDARHKSVMIEMILNAWYRDINFDFKYNWMIKNLSLFGYQPTRLVIDTRIPTKINMLLDPLDTTVGRYKWGYEPMLDFYGTVLEMTGDEIHERWLGGEKQIIPLKNAKVKKNIKNSPLEKYKILIAVTENDYYVICRDTNELLHHIEHGRGFVPALIWQNFPQPDAVEGVSDVAHIIGKNAFINTILMYAIDYLDYQTNPLLFGKNLPPGTNLKEIRESRCGGVLSDDPNASLEFIKYPVMSNEFAEILMRLDQAVQEESNISELATRASTDLRRIDAGTTVASLNMGLEAYLHLKRKQFSTYGRILNRMYLQWIDEVYRPELFGDMAIIETGVPHQNERFRFSGADINGAYESDLVFIEGQFDMIGRANVLMAQVERGLISKKLFRQMMRVPRPESEEEQIKLEKMEELRHQMMLKMVEQGMIPPPEMMGQAVPAQATVVPQQIAAPTGVQQPQPPRGLGVQPLPVNEQLLNDQAGFTIEEVKARLDSVKGLKGVAEVINVVMTEMGTPRIIIAISNPDDKQTILKQLPEYRGYIEFVHYPGLEELQVEEQVPDIGMAGLTGAPAPGAEMLGVGGAFGMPGIPPIAGPSPAELMLPEEMGQLEGLPPELM